MIGIEMKILNYRKCAGGFGISFYRISLIVRSRKMFEKLFHYKSKWMKYVRIGNIVISNQ